MGIVKTNTSVYPEQRGNGYCARLETHIECVKVLGMVNITVLASGSMFLGDMKEPANTSSDLPLISVLSATRIWMIHRKTPLPSNGSWQTATNTVSFYAILLINPILQESLMSHGTTAMLVKMWHRKSTIKEFAWRNIWKYSNKYEKLTFIIEAPDTTFLPYPELLLYFLS